MNTRLVAYGLFTAAVLAVSLTNNNSPLKEDAVATGSCQSNSGEITVSLGDAAFFSELGGYGVNSAQLTNIAENCVGANVSLTISDVNNEVVGSYTGVVDSGTVTAVFPAPVDLTRVENISVIVH